jgi:anti-sigma B factor antagonist
MNSPEDRLAVAMVEHVALVRVEGRGSFKISTSLKEFIQAAIDEGARTTIVDLGACVSMDSTFMGVLAGAAGKLRGRDHGRLVLVNLSPRTRGLIATLGLDQVVEAYDEGAAPSEFAALVQTARVETVEKQTEDKRATAETMLEAHQSLAELTPENKPRFKDVLEFLSEDLKHRRINNGRQP